MFLPIRIVQQSGRVSVQQVYDYLGYLPNKRRFIVGSLNGTVQEMEDDFAKLAEEVGHTEDEGRRIFNICYTNFEEVTTSSVKAVDEPLEIVKILKDAGIKVAVCTSDTRENTLRILKTIGIRDLVDMVVCSDDKEAKAKPDPHNALWICKDLGVDPSKAVMVGDSPADVGMARTAGIRMIGVTESGLCNEKDLRGADQVVPSIKHVLPKVLPPGRFGPWKKTEPLQAHHSPFHVTKRSLSSVPYVEEYDYIIVGAGSAGCVIANRLSADENNRVLVLEAGPEDKSWKIHMPAALMYTLFDPTYNWCYWTTPQEHLNNRELYWPRGRVWGGCSSHNAMVYVRGNALDYDGWEKAGATGWSYADCLPYFKKSQTHECGEDDYRGSSGYTQVSQGKGENPLHHCFLEAGQQAGYPFSEDMNGYQQEGVGWFDRSIGDGRRSNASNGFLRPAMYRRNLDIISKAMVNKVLFDGKRAAGIEYKKGGLVSKVHARKEVILSGGAINTPQLMLLSGVGPANHLKKHDIPVVHHLPGVGENLQDHLEVYIQHECKEPVTLYSYQWKYPATMVKTGLEWFINKTGPAASTHIDTGAFIRSRPGVEYPDIQIHFFPSVVINHGSSLGDCHAFQIHIGIQRAHSRGCIKLKSKDPTDFPLINPRYMSDERDMEEFRNCIPLAREIFAQKAFDKYRGKEILPGPDVTSDSQIDAFVRARGETAYHPSCTAKMGQPTDPMAVVDPECKVYGVEGLRVVDASIMPNVTCGNLNGPVLMLAEKAADIILGKPPLPKSKAPFYRPKSIETQR